MIRVLKIGGNQLDDPGFVSSIAQVVKRMPEPPIIVHGGGKRIKALQRKLGRQVSDKSTANKSLSLGIIRMVLCGQMNLTLVAALINIGVDAQGFNGIDRGLLRAKPLLRPDGSTGRIGEITSVRTDIFLNTLSAKIVPVVAPVMIGEDGRFLANDADKVAGAISVAMKADQLIFLTNVSGIFDKETLLEQITYTQGQDLISREIVSGGMRVKLGTALDVVLAGIRQVVITDVRGLEQETGTTVCK